MGQFARLVKEVRPAVIVMENVKGLARVRGNSTYSRFLKTLRKCNYAIREGVLNAKDYGVAQDRKRLVLIASRGLRAFHAGTDARSGQAQVQDSP